MQRLGFKKCCSMCSKASDLCKLLLTNASKYFNADATVSCGVLSRQRNHVHYTPCSWNTDTNSRKCAECLQNSVFAITAM